MAYNPPGKSHSTMSTMLLSFQGCSANMITSIGWTRRHMPHMLISSLQ